MAVEQTKKETTQDLTLKAKLPKLSNSDSKLTMHNSTVQS